MQDNGHPSILDTFLGMQLSFSERESPTDEIWKIFLISSAIMTNQNDRTYQTTV
jgi:hypothetical protein